MQNQRTTTHKNSAIQDIDFVEVRPTTPLVAKADAMLERAKLTKPIHPLAAKIAARIPKISPNDVYQVGWAFVVAIGRLSFWGLVAAFWLVIKVLNLLVVGCKCLAGQSGGGAEVVESEPMQQSSVNVSVNVKVNVSTNGNSSN